LDDAAVTVCFDVAQKLRARGFSVPPITPGKKLNKQLGHAADTGAAWAVLVGENEIQKKTVTLKNLASREQSEIPVEKLAEHLGGAAEAPRAAC
ncbi:MAG: hypothetical protein JO102_05140, partial [Elusimicrobia bacterium]|nr:hypothetical protein [Elusimicrobiota bacterium]